jgi:hypothetical protein
MDKYFAIHSTMQKCRFKFTVITLHLEQQSNVKNTVCTFFSCVRYLQCTGSFFLFYILIFIILLSEVVPLLLVIQIQIQAVWFRDIISTANVLPAVLDILHILAFVLTPSRTARISDQNLKSWKNHFWLKNDDEKWYISFYFEIIRALQRYLLTCQANSAFLGRFFLLWAAATLKGYVGFQNKKF